MYDLGPHTLMNSSASDSAKLHSDARVNFGRKFSLLTMNDVFSTFHEFLFQRLIQGPNLAESFITFSKLILFISQCMRHVSHGEGAFLNEECASFLWH